MNKIDIHINHNGFREYDARWLYPDEINLAGLEHLGLGLGTQILNKTGKEFHIPKRIIHDPTFPTQSGMAKFIYHTIPDLKILNKFEFQLLSVRSEGQFNTVVYEEEDLYRGQNKRNIILMNKNDIKSLCLEKNEKVWVKSDIGMLKNIIVRPFNVKEKVAVMYYPEVNSIISQEVDPLSKTPGFKSTVVTILKSH